MQPVFVQGWKAISSGRPAGHERAAFFKQELYSRGSTDNLETKRGWMGISSECGWFFPPVNAPSGRCSPQKGFSSLVYLIVSNTKPHVWYVKQDFRGFSIVNFCLIQKINSTAPWLLRSLNRNFLNQWSSLTQRVATVLTSTVLVRRQHALGLGSGGPWVVLGSNPDPIGACCVGPWANYLATIKAQYPGLRNGSKMNNYLCRVTVKTHWDNSCKLKAQHSAWLDKQQLRKKKIPVLILQFPNPSCNFTKLLFISYYV